MHDLHVDEETEDDVADDQPYDDNQLEEPDTRLINAAKSSSKPKLPPGDIKRVMSKSNTRSVNLTHLEYRVSYHKSSTGKSWSLVDRGANGGVAGSDVRVIFKTGRTFDIRGIDNHHVNDIDIVTVGGVVSTQRGPVIVILHQYALLNKGASIHSPRQL